MEILLELSLRCFHAVNSGEPDTPHGAGGGAHLHWSVSCELAASSFIGLFSTAMQAQSQQIEVLRQQAGLFTGCGGLDSCLKNCRLLDRLLDFRFNC